MASSDDLQARLLEAATDILEGHGIDAVTIRAVARRAEVSHGAPRRYFPTRVRLLARLAESGFTELIGQLDRLDRADDPSARLAEAARIYLRFARERPSLFELMHRHDLLEGSGIALRSSSLAALARWDELVRSARPGASRQDSVIIFATVHGLATLHSHRALEILGGDPASLLELVLAPTPPRPSRPGHA